MKQITFDEEQIKEGFNQITDRIHFECRLSRELVGGQPATNEGIEAYIKYQMQVTDPEEIEKISQRLSLQEIGEINFETVEGELKESLVGQVNVLRKTELGPWIADWMIKAAIKQTASRWGIWQNRRGSKSDMSEGARVIGTGKSLLEPEASFRIYLRNPEGNGPAKTFWQTFRGKVQTAQGAQSIVTHAECVEPGALFEFDYQFIGHRLNEDDLKRIVFALGNTGFGSSRSVERGKAEIIKATFTSAEIPFVVKEKTKEEKTAKAKPAKGKKEGQAAA